MKYGKGILNIKRACVKNFIVMGKYLYVKGAEKK